MILQGITGRFRHWLDTAQTIQVGHRASTPPMDHDRSCAHAPPKASKYGHLIQTAWRMHQRHQARAAGLPSRPCRRRPGITTWSRGTASPIAGTYLGKGQQVAIEGRLQTRSWDDDRGQRQCQVRPGLRSALDTALSHPLQLVGRQRRPQYRQRADGPRGARPVGSNSRPGARLPDRRRTTPAGAIGQST